MYKTSSVFLLARDFGACDRGVEIGVLAIPTETAGEEVGWEGGWLEGFACRSGPLQAHPFKDKPEETPLNHRHPFPDPRAAHRGLMQQLYQREEGIKPALHRLLLPVCHVPCLAAFNNECTMTWGGHRALSPCQRAALLCSDPHLCSNSVKDRRHPTVWPRPQPRSVSISIQL